MTNQSQTASARSKSPSHVLGASLALAALVFVGGCATSDPSDVQAARIKVEQAREAGLGDADSLDFQEAERHLAEAERMLEENEDQKLIDHEAEMAGVYAMVAVSRAEADVAEAEARGVVSLARIDTATTRLAVETAIRNARNIDAEQTERGLVLTLGGVLFAFNSAELTPEARLSVARVAGFMIALSERDAIVEGHADNTGAADYNLKLSKQRAESILSELVDSGVTQERLVSEGYGSNFPVASNDDAEGREKNRRVEIVILKPGLSAADARR